MEILFTFDPFLSVSVRGGVLLFILWYPLISVVFPWSPAKFWKWEEEAVIFLNILGKNSKVNSWKKLHVKVWYQNNFIEITLHCECFPGKLLNIFWISFCSQLVQGALTNKNCKVLREKKFNYHEINKGSR